jgi:hypothetical protein
MSTQSGSASPIVVVGQEPARGGGGTETLRSTLGIVSCVIAVAMGAGVAALGMSLGRSNPQSRMYLAGMLAMFFGLGAGAGIGLCGLVQRHSRKAVPAVGILLNMIIYAGIALVVLLSQPPETVMRSLKP